MQVVLDISNLREYEKKLKTMKKYDFPLAIRGTLNDAARIMKTKNIRPEFKENFIVRMPTMITAFTGYDKCKNTFDISQMHSKAGVYKGERNQKLGEDLVKQEEGGGVNDRMVPRAGARRFGNPNKPIIPRRVYRRFKSTYRKMAASGRSGAFVMGTNEQGVIIKTKDGRIVRYTHHNKKWQTLYTKPINGKIKKEPFILPAGKKTASSLPRLFLKNAEKRFKKAGVKF